MINEEKIRTGALIFKYRNEKKDLIRQLERTDYKVAKNAEYIAAGLEPPYDPVEVHAERQPLRDRINELEGLIVDLS